MQFARKHFLFGVGVGIALTLIAGRLNDLYWQTHQKKEAAASNYAAYQFSFNEGYLKLDTPEVPGYKPTTEETHSYEDGTFRSMDSRHIKISDLKGKVVFINIWATWCLPCIREISGIEKLWESLRGEPIVFLLITDEDEDRVRQYLQSAPTAFPVYLPAEKQELPKPFDNYGRPATFILDRVGRIVFRQTGAANWDQDAVRIYLRRLLKE